MLEEEQPRVDAWIPPSWCREGWQEPGPYRPVLTSLWDVTRGRGGEAEALVRPHFVARRGMGWRVERPPSTPKTWPVTQLASGERSQPMAEAMSPGSPSLPMGWSSSEAFREVSLAVIQREREVGAGA